MASDERREDVDDPGRGSEIVAVLAGSGDRQLQRSGDRTEIGRRHAVGVRGAHNLSSELRWPG